MLGYQFERNLSDSMTFRQNARFAHVDVTYRDAVWPRLRHHAGSANLARGNFLTHGIANQGDLDSQLEYRFDTGPLQHTTLFGLDLKHYRSTTGRVFGAATSLNLVNPVYTPPHRFNGAPYQDATLTQKQLGTYVQDQIKLDRFTLVLSGRNDWVRQPTTTITSAPGQDREDSQFSGRAGLIYNFDFGLAPYVSYATSYNPIIGINAADQLLQPETGEQTEVGLKFQPAGFNGHFGIAVFDLKRQNVPTTDPEQRLLQTQNGEVTSRGLELEAVANVAPGLKVVGSFTTYDLFISKDLIRR